MSVEIECVRCNARQSVGWGDEDVAFDEDRDEPVCRQCGGTIWQKALT